MKSNGSSDSRIDRQAIRSLEGSFVTQQQPTVFDLPKVLAVGLVSPAAAATTSRFGIAGTLLGLALSSVFITAGVDLLKIYLARVPGAVTGTTVLRSILLLLISPRFLVASRA